MNLGVLNEEGNQIREVTLDEAIFAARVRVPLMHQVVTAQLAAARSGTHKTKTRGEVRGGGRKPWRQKGTGRARHGSIREPQWVGGGTVFGPVPRDYRESTNKKMKALALRSALTVRAQEDRIRVVEASFEQPKTKRAVAALAAWQITGKALVVTAVGEENLAASVRNLPASHWVRQDQLNVYDILNAHWIVFTAPALDAFQTRAAQLPSRRPSIATPPAPAPEPVTVGAATTEDSAEVTPDA